MSWRVLWVWECALRDHRTLGKLPSLLDAWIEGSEAFGEISGPSDTVICEAG